jgi:hypothetical protein
LRTNKLENEKLDLSEVVDDIQRFLLPPLIASAKNKRFTENWSAGGPWK